MATSTRPQSSDAKPIPNSGSNNNNNNNNGNGESASELPTNAEDRAAAAALSSLNTNETSASENDAGVPSGAALPSAADQEALGKAMSRLEIIAGVGKAGVSGAGAAVGSGKRDTISKKSKADDKTEGGEEDKVVKKKTVKVVAEDVGLLVDQLDLTKPKATELLKAHEGDPIKAIRAYITPPTA
ncbi:hypothetical protein AJ78_06351 [Emergomyces pasteurianus Ep9510]|uniref:Nascent polypeptide-associated complex subunit alpha-like UBA domain-containing protein n=1 Tax=Emergomyces pasteurianus Ep9510 TaxID=1447872 RepID=A0A1J9QAH9_9EURO|nr:hypothetical protein AJ78_06351 [Emergomyces pasteurianus Ep9510]